jgi:hypothetical protein
MRAVMIAVLCIVLAAVASQSHAVGLYVVGKEDCNCSPLVARGIVPDALNVLKEAFLFPQLTYALDRLAQEVQTMLVQIGSPPTNGTAELKDDNATTAKPEAEKIAPKDEQPIIDKPIKDKKTSVTPAKSIKKKKKRVRIPPKAS